MRTSLIAFLFAAVAAWAANPAAAEEIYRCGDSYSQKPCPGGKLVQAEDSRNAEQRAQTTLAAERDAKAAGAMEKARLKEEAKPTQVFVPPAKPQDVAPDENKVVGATAKKPKHFTAVSPKKPGDTPPKKKKKAKKNAT